MIKKDLYSSINQHLDLFYMFKPLMECFNGSTFVRDSILETAQAKLMSFSLKNDSYKKHE